MRILLAVNMISISLRLFSLSLTRYAAHLSLPGALKVSSPPAAEARLALLFATALFNFSAYYCTLNTHGTALRRNGTVASLFCMPGRERLL